MLSVEKNPSVNRDIVDEESGEESVIVACCCYKHYPTDIILLCSKAMASICIYEYRYHWMHSKFTKALFLVWLAYSNSMPYIEYDLLMIDYEQEFSLKTMIN